MVTHIVLWKLKEDADKQAVGKEIKERLEGLVGKVPGLVSARVSMGFDGFDIALVSALESREALAAYQEHPLHMAVKQYVRSLVCDRASCDFDGV